MSKARIIGELVIVAYKAKDLPNRELVGKQDPFVVIRLGENTRKTRTDYRGGQNPIWDDQINIPVPEKKNMIVVQVFDEDSKREDLISEAEVDITKVLEDGEWDNWCPLTYKGRSAGEIYLEMTFYSARPPPKRQPTRFGNKKRPVSGGYVPGVPQRPQMMQSPQYPPQPTGRPPVPIESTSTPTYGSQYPPRPQQHPPQQYQQQQQQQQQRPQHGITSALPPPVPTPSISTGSSHIYPPQGRPPVQGGSRPASYNGPSAQPHNLNYGQNPATAGHAPLLASSYNPSPRPSYGGGGNHNYPSNNNNVYPPFQGGGGAAGAGGYNPGYPPVGSYPPQTNSSQFSFPQPQQFPGGYTPHSESGGTPFAAHQGTYGAPGGYPPQQQGYPPQGGYPPQQQGYPPQQGGYPPQPHGY